MTRRIYVASSWRNEEFLSVVRELRSAGHATYNFRENDFHFSKISDAPKPWTAHHLTTVLGDARCREAFTIDFNALRVAEATLLVLPCGKSAHLELGYAIGVGQRTAVYMPSADEPELMYLAGGTPILSSMTDVLHWAASR